MVNHLNRGSIALFSPLVTAALSPQCFSVSSIVFKFIENLYITFPKGLHSPDFTSKSWASLFLANFHSLPGEKLHFSGVLSFMHCRLSFSSSNIALYSSRD